MMRTDACGEPRIQSESRSGGARPSWPRPSGRWHEAQIVAIHGLAGVEASELLCGQRWRRDGRRDSRFSRPQHEVVGRGRGPGALFERGFGISVIQKPGPAIRLFRELDGPARRARSCGGGDDAVDERRRPRGRRWRLRSRERDEPFDCGHLPRAEHALREAGEDRVGLGLGGRPRGIGDESLDERKLSIRETAEQARHAET